MRCCMGPISRGQAGGGLDESRVAEAATILCRGVCRSGCNYGPMAEMFSAVIRRTLQIHGLP